MKWYTTTVADLEIRKACVITGKHMLIKTRDNADLLSRSFLLAKVENLRPKEWERSIPLSPLNPLLEQTRHSNQWRKINNLRFSNNIDLLLENYNSLLIQLKQLTEATEAAELLINANKMKAVVFGVQSTDKQINIYNKNIENIENFEHLDGWLTWDNSRSAEVKRRINKKIIAISKLKHICKRRNLSTSNRLQISETSVFIMRL